MNRFWRGRRIPLSWLLLTRQPVRLLVALAGISFAGILMFMQLGFPIAVSAILLKLLGLWLSTRWPAHSRNES